MDSKTIIAYQLQPAVYPDSSPFHPDEAFPEYALAETSRVKNSVYRAVRECFRLAGLDLEHFGSPQWNPLSKLIKPSETVLLKPNLVAESHPRDPDGWLYVLTHGSVIRAVADYVWKAVGEHGKVILADSPQADSSFEVICNLLQLHELANFYRARGLDFQLIDLRREEHRNVDGVIIERICLDGDPSGYIAYDLGSASEFVGHNGEGRYYGADYDEGEVNRHHSGGRHEYLISASAIKPDVVLSLPKLKTHKKAGITVSLKNLVGINGDKNWLPHHTEANWSDTGDERPATVGHPPLERLIAQRFRRLSLLSPIIGTWLHRRALPFGRRIFGDTEEVIRSGNWYGNDTLWRMCLDLNKILLYGQPDGSLRSNLPVNRKRHFAIVDGIIAGEGSGPMNPDPVAAGLILFGINCPSVDAACAWLMGFDPDRIPIVRQAFECRNYSLADWEWREITLVSNRPEWNHRLPDVSATFAFKPHFGWTGMIEQRKCEVGNDRDRSGVASAADPGAR